MPAFRLGDGALGYFAHVPKCAGTATERYLEARFGPLAMIDPRHHASRGRPLWAATSPQHMDAATFERWFPQDWFAGIFALIRHPVRRLASVYGFHRDWARTIPGDLPFSDWLGRIDPHAEPFAHDGHVRTMDEMVPAEAAVFRIEEGMRRPIDWIDALARDRAGPRGLARINTREQYLSETGGAARAPVEIHPRDIERIAEIYAADYDRFGYDPETPGALRAGIKRVRAPGAGS